MVTLRLNGGNTITMFVDVVDIIKIPLHEARDRLATVVDCFRALNAGGVLAVSEFPFPEDVILR